VGNFLSSLGHFGFSGRTLLHGVSENVDLHVRRGAKYCVKILELLGFVLWPF
jgi:hypothetical protein